VKDKRIPTQQKQTDKPASVDSPARATEDEPMDGITVFLKKKKHAELKDKRASNNHPND